MAHLDSQPLDGSNVQEILGNLGRSLSDRTFIKEGDDLERCVAKDLEPELIPLLDCLKAKKVRLDTCSHLYIAKTERSHLVQATLFFAQLDSKRQKFATQPDLPTSFRSKYGVGTPWYRQGGP